MLSFFAENSKAVNVWRVLLTVTEYVFDCISSCIFFEFSVSVIHIYWVGVSPFDTGVGYLWTRYRKEHLFWRREVTVDEITYIHELHKFLLPNDSRTSVRPVDISKGYSYRTLWHCYLNFVAWKVLEIQLHVHCDMTEELYGLHVFSTQRIWFVKGGHSNIHSVMLSVISCFHHQLPFITNTNWYCTCIIEW
jgi:hypothetical protein